MWFIFRLFMPFGGDYTVAPRRRPSSNDVGRQIVKLLRLETKNPEDPLSLEEAVWALMNHYQRREIGLVCAALLDHKKRSKGSMHDAFRCLPCYFDEDALKLVRTL